MRHARDELADVPAEAEWFANIQNKHTRDAYRRDVLSFMHFVGITRPEDFRTLTRAHVIAWRDTLGQKSAGTVRPQLSALEVTKAQLQAAKLQPE